MKKMIGVVLVIVFVSLGFQVVDTSNLFTRPRIQEYYIENMERFHKSQQLNCRDQAIEIARIQVDSVLTSEKFRVEVDSFLLYPKAKKPEIPLFEYGDDSIDIDPLFIQDTIN